jgi:hypothetical protein
VICAPRDEVRAESAAAVRDLRASYRAVFWILVACAGLLPGWAYRHAMNPDGISYIELAWASVHQGVHALVNGYWSPLYPFLLSVFFRIFHPVPRAEFTAVHFFNVALLFLSAAGFESFLGELIRARRASGGNHTGNAAISAGTMRLAGCLLFVWAARFWPGTTTVSPDVLVAAAVFFATGLLLRIRAGRAHSWHMALLGGILGLGYLAKTAMFPLAFVFLLAAFAEMKSAGLRVKVALARTALAGVVFAGIAVPYVAALSAQKGRVTFGDAGRIAYAEYVDGATKLVHWHGEAGTGTPAHPTRQISSDPAVYEFAAPIGGSYPPWYDPSYWYEGVRAPFLPSRQGRALLRSAGQYFKLFSRTGALWVALALLAVARRSLRWGGFAAGTWWGMAPAIAALAMYALVLVETRYVAPFCVVLLVWLIAKLRISDRATRLDALCIRLALVVTPALALAFGLERDASAALHERPDAEWIAAQELNRAGLVNGARVGYIGTGLDAYWAHLAGARIVAEIPEAEVARYIAAAEAKKREVWQCFASSGAQAVVTRNTAAANAADGWQPIAGTPYFVLKLPAERP